MISSQLAYGSWEVSSTCRCNVMVLHRRWCDVVWMSYARFDACFAVFFFVFFFLFFFCFTNCLAMFVVLLFVLVKTLMFLMGLE